jgi:hypothetical protein
MNNRTVNLLIIVLVFLIYGNSIPNRYSLDDEYVTDTNELVSQGISAIPEIFTTNYIVHKYYTIILSVVVLVRYANNTKNQYPLLAQGA